MRFSRGLRAALLVGLLVSLARPSNPQKSPPTEPDQLKQADAAFHAGYAALQAGNLDLARTQFAEASRLAPQIPEGHEALGTVLVELGKPADAIPELQTALSLKPGDP